MSHILSTSIMWNVHKISYFQDTQNPAASFQCIYSPSCSYSYIDSIMIQLNKLHARVLMWLSGLI